MKNTTLFVPFYNGFSCMREYPRWIKKQIKRKYGERHAIYLDVWIPYEPFPFDLLPKQRVIGYQWNCIPKTKQVLKI